MPQYLKEIYHSTIMSSRFCTQFFATQQQIPVQKSNGNSSCVLPFPRAATTTSRPHREAFSLQMSICLRDTEQFVTLGSESILLRSLFMLGALIMTVINKLPGAERENGS